MADKNIAVKAESISKCYRIGVKEDLSDSLSAAVLGFFKAPLKNFRKYRTLYTFDDVDKSEETPEDILWALKDVSFEIAQGEVVAFIGRNGAGKSTLLKILSRITDPSDGQAEIRGKVSSLLEVGTGFHKELTGRENIYLNGTILGMKKKEVDRKLEEIVDFSGVEKFLDTPVKRYSSGMKVRLAFSVAAHLEPEVLVIDEVLAVGDAEFQKKCLNKMEDVGQSGRTVLFVSHNMPAVTRLCPRAILLEHGRVAMDAPAHEVVSHYLTSGSGTIASRYWPEPESAPGGQVARLRSVRIVNEQDEVADVVETTDAFRVEMVYDVLKSGYVLHPHYYFWNQDGVCVFGTADLDPAWRGRPRAAGTYVSSVEIPGNLLRDGMIYVNAALTTMGPTVLQFWERSVVAFQVVDAGEKSARGDYAGEIAGVVRPLLRWRTRTTDSTRHLSQENSEDGIRQVF